MNQISISVDLLIDEGDTISIDNTLHKVRVVSEEEIQLAVPGSTIDVVMSPEELAEKIGESKIVYIQK